MAEKRSDNMVTERTAGAVEYANETAADVVESGVDATREITKTAVNQSVDEQR